MHMSMSSLNLILVLCFGRFTREFYLKVVFMKSSIKKFLLLYNAAIAIVILVSALVFNIYANYIISIVSDISRNPVMVHDTFSLKQSLSPIVVGDIQEIELFDSQDQKIYFHEQNKKSFLVLTKKYTVADKDNVLYTVKIKISISKFLLILLFFAFALLLLYRPFARYEQKELTNKTNEILAGLSKKLAHDIRTPLSTLNLISSKIHDPDIRGLQQSVVKQIDLIAEDLLSNNKAPLAQLISSGESIYGFLKKIENEFDIKFADSKNRFKFSISTELKKSEVIYEKQLYPIICNCLNNAIEAIDKEVSEINLSAGVQNNCLVISIEDNGHGIPEAVLAKLGHQEVTSGKADNSKSGHGIALFNAYKDITALKGSISIKSELGRFTNVKITLPLA